MVCVVNLSLEVSILCKICLSLIHTMWLTAICVYIYVRNSWQNHPELQNNAFCLQMSAIYLLDAVLGSEIHNLRNDHSSGNVNILSTSKSTFRWVLPNGLRVTNCKSVVLILPKWVLLPINDPTIFRHDTNVSGWDNISSKSL